MAPTKREIEEIIAGTVRKELAPCAVKVQVKQERDGYDDPIITVFVVIQSENTPDRSRMLGLIRRIREELNANKDNILVEGFPIVNFVSQKDANELGLEAAWPILRCKNSDTSPATQAERGLLTQGN